MSQPGMLTVSNENTFPAHILAPRSTESQSDNSQLFRTLRFLSYEDYLSVLKEHILGTQTIPVRESAGEKDAILRRVSNIVDRLMAESEILKRTDKAKLLGVFATLIDRLSVGPLRSIGDQELTRRVEKIMLVETMAGLLSDLTPDEIALFDAAVKRGKFF